MKDIRVWDEKRQEYYYECRYCWNPVMGGELVCADCMEEDSKEDDNDE